MSVKFEKDEYCQAQGSLPTPDYLSSSGSNVKRKTTKLDPEIGSVMGRSVQGMPGECQVKFR